jgi:ABC-2 type transport system ATP-binding protein
MDTPSNLTRQLEGAATLYVQIEGDETVAPAFSGLDGVREVREADRHERVVGYEIDSEGRRDIRRDVARIIVNKGWGLLELRPKRLGLEEIFLQLTEEANKDATKDAAAPPAADAPPPPSPPSPPSEDGGHNA